MGSEPRGNEASTPNVHEIEPGLVFHDAHVRITAVSVHHGTWAHAFAYRIEGSDRTIVVTGDYAPPVDAIVAACDGCDVLVSEGYPSRLADGERGLYLRPFHISTLELGALATKARAKAIVITHRRRDVTEAVQLEEIRRGFAGPVTFANDLDRL